MIAMPMQTPPGWDYPAIRPWAEIIQDIGATYRIRPKLIAAVIMVESHGNATAVAKAGKDLKAVGLMQVIARGPGFKRRPTVDELLHPRVNIRWGVRTMKWFSFEDATVEYVLYRYSGGGTWGSKKAFRENYLARVQDFYKMLWGEELDPQSKVEFSRRPFQHVREANLRGE